MGLKHQLIARGKQLGKRLKPYLSWVILGSTLAFLAQALKKHWSEAAAIQISSLSWAGLTIALGFTLLAHIWGGLLWHLILREFDQFPSIPWCVLVYLKTNIAKYLPGNVWHFYGRIWAAKTNHIPLGIATLSVVLEPLLFAAAALLLTVGTNQNLNGMLQFLGLVVVLLLLLPQALNPLLQYLTRLKAKIKGDSSGEEPELQLKRYPFIPLLGGLIFLGLRGFGFLLTIRALHPISIAQIPTLLSTFSLAWLLGLVVPGAPGGIGVFEATVVTLLDQQFSPGILLGSVGLYRLISTLAEASGAGLAWLDERLS
ncbi:MAG: UPF0104 family protein [Cyanothece sp. SIO1E1]|nr:UPF0104 family protein [Cyanothece sp. SIO1E1]